MAKAMISIRNKEDFQFFNVSIISFLVTMYFHVDKQVAQNAQTAMM